MSGLKIYSETKFAQNFPEFLSLNQFFASFFSISEALVSISFSVSKFGTDLCFLLFCIVYHWKVPFLHHRYAE